MRQRLAAILAADAVGYSRHMSSDERATLAALDAARAVFREVIDAHQGRVVDMAGDSVLALFGAATGAVAAALAIQQSLFAKSASVPEDRRLRFRIGVHLGDVMEKSDGTVYGDGVNIAARLQGLADPGGIMVSAAVHGAVRGKLAASFADLGTERLKNVGAPVHVFRIRVVGAKPQRPRRMKALAAVLASGALGVGAAVYYALQPAPEERTWTTPVLLRAQQDQKIQIAAARIEAKSEPEKAQERIPSAEATPRPAGAVKAGEAVKLAAAPPAVATAAAPAAKTNQADPDALYREALALDESGKTADAVRLYRRAARAGNGKAAKRLGDIYDKGAPGVTRDYAESLQWYQTARALGEQVESAAGR